MIVKQLLIWITAGLMLIASTGATVHQMVCLHSGNAQYSLEQISCCINDANKETIKKTCCTFFSLKFQTDQVVSVSHEKDSVDFLEGTVEVRTNSFWSFHEKSTLSCAPIYRRQTNSESTYSYRDFYARIPLLTEVTEFFNCIKIYT